LDIISDIYLNSRLDPKEIKKEKNVIVEEINMYNDHPSSHVQNLWTKVLYGDQPAGWDIAGTKESVLKITRNDILKYVDSQYNASNTIVCIAGGIEDEKSTVKKVEKYFSKIGLREPLAKEKVQENQKKPASIIEYRQTDQTHLCLGARAYNLFHPKRYSLELLSLILGGMMSSRLFIAVREELGLAYYVRTNSSLDPDAGYLVTQAGVDNSKTEKAIKAILKEYKRIASSRISAKEIKKIKDHVGGKMALLLESSDAMASFYANQELLENRILTPEEIYAKIKKITAGDILKVSKDIFKNDRLNLALVGPVKNKTAIQKILKL